MDAGFLSYAVLIEIIALLTGWIVFVHWRLSKKKKEMAEVSEVDIPVPFEVYLQFINRELSETMSHLDDLAENQSDDIEAINMYQYRLKHLDAEQKAMTESKGETKQFWDLYRSNIDFVYHEEEPEELAEEPVAETVVAETQAPVDLSSMEEELENYKTSSESIIRQSDDVLDLVKNLADKNQSEELLHMLSLLSSERDDLSSQLEKMEQEYARLMNNAALQLQSRSESSSDAAADMESSGSNISRDDDAVEMSVVLSKQNARISELNNVVGNLSLEMEEKKALIKETEWVTRQLKETEHVVIILEDENNFLRGQIKQLLDTEL